MLGAILGVRFSKLRVTVSRHRDLFAMSDYGFEASMIRFNGDRTIATIPA